MSHWYKEDLAYIHDMGFGELARQSAPAILGLLQRHGNLQRLYQANE